MKLKIIPQTSAPVAAVKNMRANNFEILGNFHSHPNSPARMSEEDKRLAFDVNLSYLILSLAENEPVLVSSVSEVSEDVADNSDTEIATEAVTDEPEVAVVEAVILELLVLAK